MASVKEVAALNSKIEKINLERTKVKTQQELLQNRLEKELAEYKESFGVDLLGANLKETKENINKEVSEVSRVVDEEYALKEKVVKAIEDGDYAYANQLMGIGVEEEDLARQVVEDIIEEGLTEEVEEDSTDAEVLYPEVDEGALAIPEDDDSDEDMDLQAMADSFSMEVEDEDIEEDIEEDEEVGISVPVTANDFLQSVANVAKTEVKGSSIKEASEDLTSGLNIGNLQVEDDEDDDIDDDFGFGDMLSGTKFGK